MVKLEHVRSGIVKENNKRRAQIQVQRPELLANQGIFQPFTPRSGFIPPNFVAKRIIIKKNGLLPVD